MAQTGQGEIVWRPSREYAEGSRLARFMRSLGIGPLAELQRRTDADPARDRDAVVRHLGVRFPRASTRGRDGSRGVGPRALVAGAVPAPAPPRGSPSPP